MRIGMLADIYQPHVSGVTHMIWLLKNRLERLGQEVFLFCFGSRSYRDPEPHVIRSPGIPLGHDGVSLGLRLTREALRVLRSMEVVHVHHPLVSGKLALRYCKPRGIPVVFSNHTRHDLYARLYARPLPPWLVDKLYGGYLRRFYCACDLVIAPSSAAKDLVERLCPACKIQLIPNGIDLGPFLEVRDSIRRQELGFRTGDVVLVYVGRLAREKNIRFLIDAFALAARRADNLRLLLVGSGPLREAMEIRLARMGIADKVHFAGSVPYGQVPRYLSCADAFVTASVTEVHALTVIEAMACGLPVLGIASPGVGDAVQDGITGLLSPPNPLQFGDSLLRLSCDAELRRLLGERARQASRAYSIESTAAAVLECYRRLLAERRHNVRIR